MGNPTFSILNFGCRASQSDGAALEQALRGKNLEKGSCGAASDVVVINTCTVTRTADAQARQAIRRIHRRNPRARIVVTGCYAQRAPEEIARMEGVTCVVGNSHKQQLATLVAEKHLPHRVPADCAESEARLPGGAEVYCSSIFESRELRSIADMSGGGRTRAFLKVQDGCSYRCSYCVIPFVRGDSRSLPLKEVLRQTRHLLNQGYKEIVLTGIHLGGYGRDLRPGDRLASLLRRLLQEEPLRRLRLSSIEPLEVTDEIIDLVATSPRMAKHFHVPLQSGSSRILGLMRRPYRAARYLELLEKIRRRVPEAAIGADVMVGFPGETQEDHALTRDLIRNSPLTYLHVFPFSRRPGTAAAQLQPEVPRAVAALRSLELRTLGEVKNRSFRESQVGRDLPVITLRDESPRSTRRALSSNFVQVELAGAEPRPNQLLRVRVTGLTPKGVTGCVSATPEHRTFSPRG
ncbi:MAG: tRNA (N(6)-L-threonylcarbamoyladenosine(37)-C(2))-methylthiotransferase MtaB [Acidobacteria bacterium]|nr:tRNA (N(6)-L-threonylcarbamoyladenosine(37)-C(2))-methylthiotransferase MtaB [Acidobacteriota bacterium]